MPSDFTVLHKLTAMVTYLLRRSKYEAIVHTLEQSPEKKIAILLIKQLVLGHTSYHF